MDKKKEQKLLNEKMDVHDDDEDTMSNTERHRQRPRCLSVWNTGFDMLIPTRNHPPM